MNLTNIKNIVSNYLLNSVILLFGKIWSPKFDIQLDEKTKNIIEKGGQIIFVADHSDLIIILVYILFSKEIIISLENACTMTSESKEGNIANYLISKSGITCISRKSLKDGNNGVNLRSKSLRGLLKLFKIYKQYLLMALNEKDKNNYSRYSSSSIIASKHTGAAIVPVSCSSSVDVRLNRNWDLMKIPLGKKYINIGEPVNSGDCDWNNNREVCEKKLLHLFKKLESENLKKIRHKKA